MGIIGSGVAIGFIAGLNAYRRYNNAKRETITEEKQVELGYVEKLLHDRQTSALGRQ